MGFINGNFEENRIIHTNLNKNNLKHISLHWESVLELQLILFTLDQFSSPPQDRSSAYVTCAHVSTSLAFVQ